MCPRATISYYPLYFSCDQAALWMVLSPRLSVRPTVRPSASLSHHFTMFLSSYNHENFRSNYHWPKWCPCKRSQSEVKHQRHRGQNSFCRFQTVRSVWTYWWLWNDTQIFTHHRRGVLMFFKIFRQTLRSNGTKSRRFWLEFSFSDFNSSLNSRMALKWCTKLDVIEKRSPIVFQGRLPNFKDTWDKIITDFDPNLAIPDCNSSLNSPIALEWCKKLGVV